MRVALAALLSLSAFGCQDLLGVDGSAPPPPDDQQQAQACDPVSQQGCQSGEKCGFRQSDPLTGVGGFECVGDGTVPEGGACDPVAEVDACEAGLHCVQGTCMQICDDQTQCPRGACLPLLEKARVGVDFQVCVQQCSPFLQDCDELACYLGPEDGPLCLVPGILGIREPCRDSPECGVGLGCHRTPFGGEECLLYCDLASCTDTMGQPSECGCGNCSAEDVCVEVDDPQLAGQGFGVCLNAEEAGCFCDIGGVAICGGQKG